MGHENYLSLRLLRHLLNGTMPQVTLACILILNGVFLFGLPYVGTAQQIPPLIDPSGRSAEPPRPRLARLPNGDETAFRLNQELT